MVTMPLTPPRPPGPYASAKELAIYEGQQAAYIAALEARNRSLDRSFWFVCTGGGLIILAYIGLFVWAVFYEAG